MPKLQPTLHKGFNKVAFNKKNAGIIFTGNAITNLQLSWYIRPFTELYCTIYKFEPGKLRGTDLEVFDGYPLPIGLLSSIYGSPEDTHVLYLIRTYQGVYGWLLENVTKKWVAVEPAGKFSAKRSSVLLNVCDAINKDRGYV